MKEKKTKRQLRRCAFCGKPGHNKSTCPEFLASLENRASAPVMNFFVHHTPQPVKHSPHLINLKNPRDVWKEIETEAPAESPTPLYHFYHELPEEVAPAAPIIKDTPAAREPDFPEMEILPEKIFKPFSPPAKKTRKPLSFPKISLGKKLAEFETAALSGLKNYLFTRRTALALTALILVLVIPSGVTGYYQSVKKTVNQISGDGTEGFMALQESTAALLHADLPGAQSSLAVASDKLNKAAETMQSQHRFLQNIASIIPFVDSEVQSRQNIILAGQKIAAGNTRLLQGLEQCQAKTEDTPTERLHLILENFNSAIPSYREALQNLSAVKTEVLPLEYQSPFNDFRLVFTGFFNDLQNLSQLGSAFEEIFGGAGRRRYLLVFQNPHELRPTGGFMGSFALLEVKDGAIVKMNVPAGGTYDLQGQLSEYVIPPTPLLLSNKRWEFQDANWFPDFPASAEKMMWFYRKSRGMSVDGVIAINASVLERLLAIMGPLTDEKRNVTITSATAVPVLQTIVEEGPEKKINKPKQILADLAPKFLDYFKNIKTSDLLPLLLNAKEALEQKEIQAYFSDAPSETTISSFGWGGKILPTEPGQDYLMVVNTNIQGQKSDAEIKQSISHQALVQPDGSVIDTVIITREHTGTGGEKLYGQTNIDYLRIYVPLGSELLAASGFVWPDENKFRVPESWAKKDVQLSEAEKETGIDPLSGTRLTEEFGKTAFGNWIITDPGEKNQVQFTYRLPAKIFSATADNLPLEQWKKLFTEGKKNAHYQLVVQRQSGCDSSFDSQIILPEDWIPVWNEGAGMTTATNGAAIGVAPLLKDSVFSLVAMQR